LAAGVRETGEKTARSPVPSLMRVARPPNLIFVEAQEGDGERGEVLVDGAGVHYGGGRHFDGGVFLGDERAK